MADHSPDVVYEDEYDDPVGEIRETALTFQAARRESQQQEEDDKLQNETADTVPDATNTGTNPTNLAIDVGMTAFGGLGFLRLAGRLLMNFIDI